MCYPELFSCIYKCCWDSCQLVINSKSFLAEKILDKIIENPISSIEMDTLKNSIRRNWSSLYTNEKKELKKICNNKIVKALLEIEIIEFENKNIIKEFTDRNINRMIDFIGHQINYNLKCYILNYFKKDTDDTKHKYTKIITPKKNYNGDYINIPLPSTKNMFICDYTEDFLKMFLVLKNKKTGHIHRFSRNTKTKIEYEKLHEKYINIVKTIYENNIDYKQIILDSFKYIDNEDKMYYTEKEQIKDFQ